MPPTPEPTKERRLRVLQFDKARYGNPAAHVFANDDFIGMWDSPQTPVTVEDVVKLINAANGYDDAD